MSEALIQPIPDSQRNKQSGINNSVTQVRSDGGATLNTSASVVIPAATFIAPEMRKGFIPVSYTHLDVYKRQSKPLVRKLNAWLLRQPIVRKLSVSPPRKPPVRRLNGWPPRKHEVERLLRPLGLSQKSRKLPSKLWSW